MALSTETSKFWAFNKISASIAPYFLEGLLLFGIFIALYMQGPILQPDSSGYLNNATIRSPLYPIILNIYRLFFTHFQVLIALQLLFGFTAAYYTASCLRTAFSFPKVVFWVILVILLSPYYGPGLFGNAILTEALCYPLFLLMFSFLIQGLLYQKNKYIIFSMGFVGLLVLTRGQFLFLYPAFAIILGFLFFFTKKQFKIGLLALSLVILILTANLFERTYQYLYHGKFAQVPFTGVQLVIAPLYLAHADDSKYLKSETQKAFFKDVYAAMLSKKINFPSLDTDSYFHQAVYHHFYDNYNLICWGTLSSLQGKSKYNLDTPYKIDSFFTEMGLNLILNNLKGFFILYLMNVIFNLGGLYYSLFVLAVTLIAFYCYIKNRSPLSMITLVVSLLTAGNYLLVALVEPVLRRYSVYTDVLLISILLIIASTTFLSDRKHSNSKEVNL